MSEVEGNPWKEHKDSYVNSLYYLQGRQSGTIRSLKTPWTKMNDAGTAGLEWNTTTVIAGRSGSGKSLISNQIVRESFDLNPGENFKVLEFSLEMLGRVSAIREYCSVLGKSYKYLTSADEGKLSKEDLDKCLSYAKSRKDYPVHIVEKPPTVKEFVEIIKKYLEYNSFTEGTPPRKVYCNTVITLDHATLLKRTSSQSKQDLLHELGEACTDLRRKYPIAFIILSQLNRSIDNPERNEDGKYGNYILASDLSESDALLQHADLIVGLNLPGKRKIRFFGPERYIIDNENILVMHYIKCRNGDTRMSFYRAEFDKMKIVEIPTPGQQVRNIRT